MPTPLEILQAKFGYGSWRGQQEQIIETILNGQDALALMPTGGGKSLCYQIPALIFGGLTVVISPLIALMKDQVDALRVNGIPSAYLNSSLSPQERDKIINQLRRGEIKLLYLAPERLFASEQSFIYFLKELTVSLFAIDEAHCISHWGHDFRPEYRLLSTLKREFPAAPTLALTATADQLTRQDILEKLALRQPRVFISSFNRANILYSVEPKRNFYPRLAQYLKKHREDSGIIYALSRQSTENLAADLTSDGFSALPYHAGLPQETRQRHQEMFIKDEVKIIIATIAFGMGINKSNVRFVIHADLPKNIESYYQETGRAGRDGLPSEALLFYSGGDVIKLKKFALVEDNPEQTRIMLRKLDQMAELCESAVCRRKRILNYFGEQTAEQCANCDVCLTEYDRFDGTQIAQKALSAVARLEGRFGLTYVIDFLRGSQSEKIKTAHKILPTYGVGADLSKEEWYRYVKEIIAQGYLAQSAGEYPVLGLTAKSPAVLRGEENVSLVKVLVKRAVAPAAVSYEEELFRQLKQIRAGLARSENLPAYVVLSDATLAEMAAYLPADLTELRKISGFGDLKTARYGHHFLPAISAYCHEHGLTSRIADKIPKRERRSGAERISDTKAESLRLFKAGNSVAQVATLRDLSANTIESHLAHFVARGEVSVTELVSSGKIPLITAAIQKHGVYALIPIKAELGEAASYGEIKAVLAGMRN